MMVFKIRHFSPNLDNLKTGSGYLQFLKNLNSELKFVDSGLNILKKIIWYKSDPMKEVQDPDGQKWSDPNLLHFLY